MTKNIIICADGTWNEPEIDTNEDYPTNILKISRAISDTDNENNKQVVFYDWGIGSYHDKALGGISGKGLEKNIMDCYRFIVHNYTPGDKLYFFGFSRGAYTIRSLCGLINCCSILHSKHGNQIQKAFNLYKNTKVKPNSDIAFDFIKKYAVEKKPAIKFVGAFDTVGAMGIPTSFWGFLKKRELFYDQKLGSNVLVARQALALDEKREPFQATLWLPKQTTNLKQTWFSGVHTDVGGGNKPIKDSTLSDIPLMWMVKEAKEFGLKFKQSIIIPKTKLNYLAEKNISYTGIYRTLGEYPRVIPDPEINPTFIHASVEDRYIDGEISKPIKNFIKTHKALPPLDPNT